MIINQTLLLFWQSLSRPASGRCGYSKSGKSSGGRGQEGCEYKVAVMTGNKKGAGTDAKVLNNISLVVSHQCAFISVVCMCVCKCIFVYMYVRNKQINKTCTQRERIKTCRVRIC